MAETFFGLLDQFEIRFRVSTATGRERDLARLSLSVAVLTRNAGGSLKLPRPVA